MGTQSQQRRVRTRRERRERVRGVAGAAGDRVRGVLFDFLFFFFDRFGGLRNGASTKILNASPLRQGAGMCRGECGMFFDQENGFFLFRTVDNHAVWHGGSGLEMPTSPTRGKKEPGLLR